MLESAIIIGLVAWLIFSIPETNRKYKQQREAEKREAEIHAREDAYFADLAARADAGDEKAVALLKWHGYDVRGWQFYDFEAKEK